MQKIKEVVERVSMSRVKGRLPLLYLIGFTANSSIHVVAPVVPIFTIQSLNGSVADAGYVVSAFYIASMAVKTLLAISGREQRATATLLLSCVLILAAPLAYRYSSSLGVFFLSRFVHGTGFALLAASALSLATLMSGQGSRGKAINNYTGFLALGLMIGPAISSLFLVFVGIREIFILSAAVASPSVLCSLLLFKSFKIRLPKESGSLIEPLRSRIASLFAHRDFMFASLSYFSYAFAYGAFLSYAPVYLKQVYGFPASLVTALFSGYFTLTAISRFFVYKVQKVVGAFNFLVATLLGASLLGLVIFSVRALPVFVGAFLMMGFVHGIIFPLTAIIVMRTVEATSLILANSVYLLAFDLGTTAGPILTSGLARYQIPAALMASVMPCFLAGVSILFTRSRRG
ncbi:MAG: MFS transporter [Candidatus Bathyarchaeia archaeon]